MNLSSLIALLTGFLIGVLAGKAQQRPSIHRTFILHSPLTDAWHSRIGGVN
jgi:hypothetical protein